MIYFTCLLQQNDDFNKHGDQFLQENEKLYLNEMARSFHDSLRSNGKRWLLRYSHVWRHSITLQLRTLLTSHCSPKLVFAHRDKTRTLSSFLVDACKLTIVGAVINLGRLTGNKRYSSLNVSPPTLVHQGSLSLLGSCQDLNFVKTHNIFSLCSQLYRWFLRHIFLAAKPKLLTTWI